MAESEQNFPGANQLRANQLRAKQPASRWRWIGGIALLFIVAIIVLGIVVHRAEPTLRAAVIETLSTRFKSKVELDAFHVSLLKGLQVSGAGLRIFGETDANNHEPGLQPVVFQPIIIQPIISVAEFRFHMGIRDLFRRPMHVDTVYVKGLQLNLPPKEHRSEMNNVEHAGGKIEIIVDRLVSDQAQLIVNTLRPGKRPLQHSASTGRADGVVDRLPLTTHGGTRNRLGLTWCRSHGVPKATSTSPDEVAKCPLRRPANCRRDSTASGITSEKRPAGLR